MYARVTRHAHSAIQYRLSEQISPYWHAPDLNTAYFVSQTSPKQFEEFDIENTSKASPQTFSLFSLMIASVMKDSYAAQMLLGDQSRLWLDSPALRVDPSLGEAFRVVAHGVKLQLHIHSPTTSSFLRGYDHCLRDLAVFTKALQSHSFQI
jgi:hypothetical protein